MRSGSVSAHELVSLCLERIAAIDPSLGAFRVVFAEQALAEASSVRDGPLAGVPIAVKDDMDVAGSLTAQGSAAVVTPVRADSEVVARLRAAGAIVIGKTSMPELGQWGAFTESAAFGVTRNPWDRSRSPGGSSGGSAAAVAAGLVPGALGSDGGASIRVPAACCGLIGLKPQRGRVPTSPFDERWNGLVMYGPLARTVEDAALLLDVVGSAPPSFADAARVDPPRLRVGVSVAPGVPWVRLSDEVVRAVEATARLLEELGHEVVPFDPPYLAVGPLTVPRMLRGVHDEAASVERPELLEPRTRAVARRGGLFAPRLVRALRALEPRWAARALGGHDVLLTPVTTSTPPPVGRWEGRGAIRTYAGTISYFSTTPAWNLSGQPALSLPAGFARDGMPLGVQLVGRPHDEATLLALAAQLERARPWADARPDLDVGPLGARGSG